MHSQSCRENLKARFEAEAIPLLPRLYPTALRLSGNVADAEDLLQETYLRAYRGFHRFEAGTNLTGWLYRILRNTFNQDYRKRRREPTTVPEGRYQPNQTAQRNAAASAETIVVDSVPDEELRAALSSLPERYLRVVLLYEVDGYSYKEIARIVGAPLGTVMSRLHRGRQALRARMRAPADGRLTIADRGQAVRKQRPRRAG